MEFFLFATPFNKDNPRAQPKGQPLISQQKQPRATDDRAQGIITALAGNDCDEDESKSFELIEISEGRVVAAAWRYEECP